MQHTRTYECMCLLDNREVRKGWQPLKDAVTGIFRKHGAEVLSARRWDERRLAYQINGQQRGTYMLAYIKAGTQQLGGIRRDLQFSEPVLRSCMLVCDEVPAAAYEPEAEFDVNTIPLDDAPETATGEPAAPHTSSRGDASDRGSEGSSEDAPERSPGRAAGGAAGRTAGGAAAEAATTDGEAAGDGADADSDSEDKQ